jgi:hypothetical protein
MLVQCIRNTSHFASHFRLELRQINNFLKTDFPKTAPNQPLLLFQGLIREALTLAHSTVKTAPNSVFLATPHCLIESRSPVPPCSHKLAIRGDFSAFYHPMLKVRIDFSISHFLPHANHSIPPLPTLQPLTHPCYPQKCGAKQYYDNVKSLSAKLKKSHCIAIFLE